jgi:hypothetical protein
MISDFAEKIPRREGRNFQNLEAASRNKEQKAINSAEYFSSSQRLFETKVSIVKNFI